MKITEAKTLNGISIKTIPFDIIFSVDLVYIKNLYRHKKTGLLVENYFNYEQFNNIKKTLTLNPYQCCHNLLNVISHLNNANNGDKQLRIAESLISELGQSATEFRSAIYFSYPFEFTLLDKFMQPPRYSSLCQGYALSAFTQISKITNNQKYTEMTDKIHNSFLQFRTNTYNSQPWIIFVDEESYLWFEKYPSVIDPQTRVLNGHIYSIMGLYSYYCHNKDEQTLSLIRAGMTTVQRYFNKCSRPGNVNGYSLQTNSYADYSPIR